MQLSSFLITIGSLDELLILNCQLFQRQCKLYLGKSPFERRKETEQCNRIFPALVYGLPVYLYKVMKQY
jgi:hypothetical protein